ncbi:hypothetical protein LCGC14_3065470, partial [marine sediment metagenome]
MGVLKPGNQGLLVVYCKIMD